MDNDAAFRCMTPHQLKALLNVVLLTPLISITLFIKNPYLKDLRDGIDLMTDIETLKDLHTSPLHVLLRVGEGFFKAGLRNKAGVFKYDVPITVDDHWAMWTR